MMNSKVTNEDCMALMARYPDKYFDLAVVDPPYGNKDAIGLKNNIGNKKQATIRTVYNVFNNIAPDYQYFEELKRVSKNQIIWGANFFGISGGYICWNKFGTAFGEAELAYCSMINSVRVFEYRWNGMLQQDMKNKEHRIHPTQKPVALYDWIFQNYAKPTDKILDTHLGSGSSRIAAHKNKLDFTACELDAEYFEAQERRFEAFVSQTTLF